MKKLVLILGVAILMFVGAQSTQAENAGLGFEYGTGMMFPMTGGVSGNGFVNSFIVSWSVNDNLAVGVFRDDVRIRSKSEYKNETSLVTYKMTQDGTIANSGIRISAIIPGLEMLQFGIDLGSAQIETYNVQYTRTDGTAGGAADFGVVASPSLTGMNPLAGLTAKWSMINSKAKGIWTEIALTGSLRMVPVNETYLNGVSKVNSDKPLNELGIDSVTSMNSADVLLGITLGF